MPHLPGLVELMGSSTAGGGSDRSGEAVRPHCAQHERLEGRVVLPDHVCGSGCGDPLERPDGGIGNRDRGRNRGDAPLIGWWDSMTTNIP